MEIAWEVGEAEQRGHHIAEILRGSTLTDTSGDSNMRIPKRTTVE